MPELASPTPQHAPTPATASGFLAECQLAYANAAKATQPNIGSCIKALKKDVSTPYISPYKIAFFYIARKDKDSAFCWLEQARQAHSADLSYVRADPRLDDLRSDVRFNNLLEEVGLSR